MTTKSIYVLIGNNRITLGISTRQFCEQGVECSMDPFEGVEGSLGSLSICRLVLAPWVLSVP